MSNYFKKLSIVFIFSFALLFIVGLVWAGNLEIHIIDVGVSSYHLGDSELIISPTGTTVLIDAGMNGQGTATVIPYLNSLGITSLDYTIVSHYHADHIGGLDEVIDALGVKIAGYDRGGSYTTGDYTNYVNAIGSKRKTISPGDVIDIGGGATLKCIGADGKVLNAGTIYTGTDENLRSVVLILKYNNFEMYLGGDVEGVMEPPLANVAGDVDVYKVSHHGGPNGSTTTLLSKIKPEISTISVGDGNGSGHPFTETLNRLVSANSYIYLTERGSTSPVYDYTNKGEIANGSFKIVTNGCTYTVSGSSLITRVRNVDSPCTPPDTTLPIFAGLQSATDPGTGGSVVLTWNAATDTSLPITYNIYRATTSGGQNFTSPNYVTQNLSYTVSGLTNGITYYFVVRAVDSAGNMEKNTVEKSATPTSSNDTTPPTFAGLQSATDAQSGGKVNLSWNAGSDPSVPITYNIYYSTTSGGQNFATPNYTTTNLNYSVTGLTNGIRYYFVVRARDNAGNIETNTVERSATPTETQAGGIDHIVFSEVLFNSKNVNGTYEYYEWCELYNPTPSSVNIGGWTIIDNSSTPAPFTIPTGTTLAPYSYYVIAKTDTAFYGEYGFNPDAFGFTFGLSNSGDYLILKNSSGTVIDQVAWKSGGGSIPGVTWGSTTLPTAGEDSTIARASMASETNTYIDWLSSQKPTPGEPVVVSVPIKKTSKPVIDSEFELGQSYPNPFNPHTNISYKIPVDSYVSLKVYNISGEFIRTLDSGSKSAGNYIVSWDGKDYNGNSVPSGIYIYRLSTNSFSSSKRMILIK